MGTHPGNLLLSGSGVLRVSSATGEDATMYPFEKALKIGRILGNPAVPSREKNELRARLSEILPAKDLSQVSLNFGIVADELRDIINFEPKTKEVVKSIRLLRQDLEAVRHAIAAIITKNLPEWDDNLWFILNDMNKSCEAFDLTIKVKHGIK
jgi:hypothetical protein